MRIEGERLGLGEIKGGRENFASDGEEVCCVITRAPELPIPLWRVNCTLFYFIFSIQFSNRTCLPMDCKKYYFNNFF